MASGRRLVGLISAGARLSGRPFARIGVALSWRWSASGFRLSEVRPSSALCRFQRPLLAQC